jgi:small subunit ribosomal protein S5
VAHATIAGLKGLKRPDEIAALRGKRAEDVIPRGVLQAYRERRREGDLFTEVS